MRCLYPDSDYFACLNELLAQGEFDSLLAAAFLVQEFPGLRMDEARAVCTDWRFANREAFVHNAPAPR